MIRLWLVFAQAVTVVLAILFVMATLKPEWVRLGGRPVDAVGGITPGPAPASGVQTGAPASHAPPFSYSPAVVRAAPSVVNVYTTKTIDSSDRALPNDDMLRKFFGLPIERPRPRLTTSLGSGVLMNAEGYILTNYHVVEAADAIEVALFDGRTFVGTLVGADPDTDLAVLRLPAGTPDVPVADVSARRDLVVGDVVLAIGNPFGVGQTTTLGIVSGTGRSRLGINTYENFIQTDAAINPGNSGGALVDAAGVLVGINTAIYSPPGGAMGIGFAIPVETATNVLDAIIRDGHVARGWLGVEPQDLTAGLARSFGLKDPRGAIIAGVIKNGPAGRAGVRVGDIVRSVDGAPVLDTTALLGMIAALPPGHRTTLSILRQGKALELELAVGARPQRPSR